MKIPNKVKKLLENIPNKPGVYQFKDKEGNVLYIGKAINLKKRVKSYFQQFDKHSVRIQKLVSQIEDIDYTAVSSELEAIILESNLIKEILPKYNILMKDDKNFVYIKITKEDFPQISIVRKVLNDGALYFGPKTAAHKVKKTLDVLKKIFPYRHCSLFLEYQGGKINVKKKTTKYPCLDYHIKRCIGPCVGNCTKDEYQQIIHQIIRFLQGKSDEIIKTINSEMQQAAKEKKFEKAAKLRDKLHAINEIREKQLVSAPHREDMDVVNFVSTLGRIYFTLFMIRDGKLIGQENFIFKSGSEDEQIDDNDEVFEAFLNQYYEKTTDFPKEILLPHKLQNGKTLERWITDLKDNKVTIQVPQKGEKHKILELALKNAKLFAQHSKAKWQTDNEKRKKALEELKDKLKLKKIPRRIECFDISHISGTNQVASMIVFENGASNNKKYRRFKIRTVQEGKPDDFAAMLEVLKRRFLYLVKSKSDIKFRKTGKILKGKLDKKEVGTCMYEIFDDLDYFSEIKVEEHLNEFLIGLIQKAKNNRVYIGITNKLVEDAEKVGFQVIKKHPNQIKLKKGLQCLLFNKSKYKEEKGFSQKPDLIVIDGGKGQLTQGVKVENKFDIDIPLVALAKKNEDVFVPGKSSPVPLKKDSEGLYLLQQVRDEAHRFAIAYNKKLRSKSMFQ